MTDRKRIEELEKTCAERRIELIRLLHRFGTGHPGGSLSAMEIIVALYHEILDVEKIKRKDDERDRVVLSKGHCAPTAYLTLADLGFFPLSELDTFRQPGSILQGHPCADKTPGIEISTGPLGLGFASSVGIAMSAKIQKKDYRTYVILGDGEIQEGVVWEAAMAASKYRLDNLTAFLDYNGVQLDGFVNDIMPLGDVAAKWEAFGWETISINGNDMGEILDAIKKAQSVKDRPVLIIGKTVKGKGISFMENTNEWHGKPIDDEHYAQAMKELGGELA